MHACMLPTRNEHGMKLYLFEHFRSPSTWCQHEVVQLKLRILYISESSSEKHEEKNYLTLLTGAAGFELAPSGTPVCRSTSWAIESLLGTVRSSNPIREDLQCLNSISESISEKHEEKISWFSDSVKSSRKYVVKKSENIYNKRVRDLDCAWQKLVSRCFDIMHLESCPSFSSERVKVRSDWIWTWFEST